MIFQPKAQKLFLTIVGLLLLMGIAVLLVHTIYSHPTPQPDGTTTLDTMLRRLDLRGEYVCLPHKPNTPATEECAAGIKADGGGYYALDMAILESVHELKAGDRIEVEGVFTPFETLNSDHWQNYADFRGIISTASLTSI